jgi:peroxiredoxin
MRENTAVQLLKRGDVVTDFALRSTAGKEMFLSDVRGRSAMVLVLAGSLQGSIPGLLQELTAHREQINANEGGVVVVLAKPQSEARKVASPDRWPFVTLADESGKVHRRLGAVDGHGRPASAVYITDRFGEVFAAFAGETLPSIDEIIRWLAFIGIQCEECFPSEWQG